MSKVNFQPPISGTDLKLPDLPPEEQPASDSLPKITHARSEQKAHNAQKNCIKTTQTMSANASRQHVVSQSEKKSKFSRFATSLINHIKGSNNKSNLFSKFEFKKERPSNINPLIFKENETPTADEINLNRLKYLLPKLTEKLDDTKKQQLSTTMRQCFGELGGEPNPQNLLLLKRLADPTDKPSEYHSALKELTVKIDDILLKNMTGEFMAGINKAIDDVPSNPVPPPPVRTASANKAATSDEIDSLFKELDYDIFNPPFSTKTNADSVNPDDILNMLNTDTPRSPTSAKTVASADELESALTDLDDEVKKTKDSDELDEILNELNTDTSNSPTSAKTVTSADELESALQALDEEKKKGK